jgi:hypothetical protein
MGSGEGSTRPRLDLLRSELPPVVERGWVAQRIVLEGTRGSGKTTLRREVARCIGVPNNPVMCISCEGLLPRMLPPGSLALDTP